MLHTYIFALAGGIVLEVLSAGSGAKHAACLPWSQCFNDFVADSSRTAISLVQLTPVREDNSKHISVVTVVDVRSAVYKAIFLRPRPPHLQRPCP